MVTTLQQWTKATKAFMIGASGSSRDIMLQQQKHSQHSFTYLLRSEMKHHQLMVLFKDDGGLKRCERGREQQ